MRSRALRWAWNGSLRIRWSSLIDPIAQLRQWVGKVFHLHGKDATVDRWAVEH